MIKEFKHKGLRDFFLTGSKKGIQATHEIRLRRQLTVLNSANDEMDMNIPGWNFHELKGDLKGHFAVTVNKNWRLTFKFENGDAFVVDYQDYH
tara:strand:+ start:767 stop:1045 length:279 start_codon:yes stop_codon:yes gene_type:complete